MNLGSESGSQSEMATESEGNAAKESGSVSSFAVVLRKEFLEAFRNWRFPLMAVFMIGLSALAGQNGANLVNLQDRSTMTGSSNATRIYLDPTYGLSVGIGLSFQQVVGNLMPLLALLLSADLLTKERETRTIIKLVSKARGRIDIIGGKFAAFCLLGLALAGFSTFAAVLTYIYFLSVPLSADDYSRVFVYALMFGLFWATWGSVGLFFSSLLRRSVTAIVVSIVAYLIESSWSNISFALSSWISPASQVAQTMYQINLLSLPGLLSDVSSFLLVPNNTGVGQGQISFNPYQAIGVLDSLSMTWLDVAGAIVFTIVLVLVVYTRFKRLNITPQG